MTEQIKVLSRDEEPFPKPCHLCGKQIESNEDLDWHGLGNCAEMCSRCDGSGQEPTKQEPAPKWEPGTVLRGCSEIYRLDVFSKLGDDKQSEIWDFTDMHTGESLTGGAFPYQLYEIHRLSNEFRRDDWAQVVSGLHEPFKVNTIVPKGNGDSYVYGREQQQWLASSLKHVPPPKEEKAATRWEPGMWFLCNFCRDNIPAIYNPRRVESIRGDNLRDTLGTDHLIKNCVPTQPPKEEKPSLQVKSCEHCGKTIDGMDPRIHPHGLGVCARRSENPENPFKGRHWDEVARDANRDDALAETLCIRDLRDELDRQAGRKP